MAFLNAPIGVSLPSISRSNNFISTLFPEWTTDSIFNKVGIQNRYVCDDNENSLTLALSAYHNLISKLNLINFDLLLYVSNSSQYQAPGDGHLFLSKLNLTRNVGCVDINLGCSGYTYALGIASALVNSNSANEVLVVTSDAYSKFILDDDKGNLTLFGDGSTASIVSKKPLSNHSWEIDNFKYGSNGIGHNFLNIRSKNYLEPKTLFMDGPKVFNFTSNEVVNFIKAQKIDIDKNIFIFHQANKFMLDYMKKKLNIPEDRMIVDFSDTGNLVSSSIPYVLQKRLDDLSGKMLFLCGFGIGASYSSVCLKPEIT
jgi:3-oxoacyl-[acyl-carrier-protein] synthase-3